MSSPDRIISIDLLDPAGSADANGETRAQGAPLAVHARRHPAHLMTRRLRRARGARPAAHPLEPRWYTVRCLFLSVFDGAASYEERMTLWQASDFGHAIRMAETEAEGYATEIEARYLGISQACWVSGSPTSGSEMFSVIRDSTLTPLDYVDRFLTTGNEHESGGT